MHEVSADDLDIASDIQQQYNDLALAQVRSRMLPEHDPDFDGFNCLDCDNPLPEVRLAMWKIRCVPCQEAKDRRKKLYGT